jgi:hypothetical protein
MQRFRENRRLHDSRKFGNDFLHIISLRGLRVGFDKPQPFIADNVMLSFLFVAWKIYSILKTVNLGKFAFREQLLLGR